MLTPEEIEVLLLSIKIAFWATICSVPPGIIVAWILSRTNFLGKIIFDGLVHLPLVLPPVVVGYILLVTFNNNSLLGQLLTKIGIEINFNWKGAAIASGLMAFPLLVRAIRLSFDMIDQRLEDAARTLGAGPISLFFTVSIPLIAPGIITGAILAFARCLGEFGATITFVSNIPGTTRTLPLAVYTLVQTPGGEDAAIRLVCLSLIIALVALAISEIVSRKARKRLGIS